MDSEGAILVLRLLHIVAGVFWVGAAITVTFFTMPVVRATGAVGGEFWGQFMARSHFSQVMPPRRSSPSAAGFFSTGISIPVSPGSLPIRDRRRSSASAASSRSASRSSPTWPSRGSGGGSVRSPS